MKTRRIFAVAAVILTSIAALAETKSNETEGKSYTSDYNVVYLQCNPSTFAVSTTGVDDESFTGFSAGYSHAFSLSNTIPLFLETGIALQYSYITESLADDVSSLSGYSTKDIISIMDPEEKISMLSAKIPINITYNWHIPNTRVAISPFIGLSLRCNISAKYELNWNLTNKAKKYLLENMGQDAFYDTFSDQELDLFSKRDMGTSDDTWNRLQLGWQAGFNIGLYDRMLIGISYGTDFNNVAKNINIHTTSITLGYCF